MQQKPLELDTVHQELPHEVDQVHLEVLELQKQVAELEKHLRTAQQEGGRPPGRKQLRAEVGPLYRPPLAPPALPGGCLCPSAFSLLLPL